MSHTQDKVMDLDVAVSKYVVDGSHVSVGGFTINRNPMAAVYSIIRHGVKNLHVYAHSNGVAIDELIGADCVSRLEIAYSGAGKTAPTCIRFRKAVQENRIEFEDYSNYMMSLRFLAGAMGVPFLPTCSGLGSDIVTKWGFSEAMRAGEPRIVGKKLVVVDNPFGDWFDTPKVVLVPAIRPDVTIIHVQQADRYGTCRIEGLTFLDVEQAKAARNVIVTCERLADVGELRESPERNQIPFIHVSAVCVVPHGAYPTATYRHYDYDAKYLRDYTALAADDARFEAYQKKYIHGVANHNAFLDLVGEERLEAVRADARTGYAVNMSRD